MVVEVDEGCVCVGGLTPKEKERFLEKRGCNPV